MTARKNSTLTPERVRELLHYDPISGEFTWKVDRMCGRYYKQFAARVGQKACSASSRGRVQITIDDRRYKAHRIAWLHVYGEWPKEIDHIDGNPSNNAIVNLRESDRHMNMQNLRVAKKSNKSCGLLGVTRHWRKYVAQITVNRKHHYLGIFDTAEGAHEAYLNAKRAMHKGCTI